MDEKKKKEAIDAEVVDGENKNEEKKEKKENGFSKFFNKAKTSINNSILEGKIESSFNNANLSFTVYVKNDAFGHSVHGKYLNDDKTQILIFGEKDFEIGSVVVDNKDESAYYLTGLDKGKCQSIVEGVEYERNGTIINLDKNVEEVNVIKAGKRYFIYKGK